MSNPAPVVVIRFFPRPLDVAFGSQAFVGVGSVPPAFLLSLSFVYPYLYPLPPCRHACARARECSVAGGGGLSSMTVGRPPPPPEVDEGYSGDFTEMPAIGTMGEEVGVMDGDDLATCMGSGN